ncbi:MAG: PAS domain-containing protein [Rhodospirillaceae bacterium]|jgi:hypothetical protein|nr:PAS domain-containing protein [Rhodospirillaceae bacterium]MBT4486716.1 PAS domain-containing protein [Rhodospirillaceae bacterium]MBT6431333.1 PAS domain-containing protein [Rhodospirillaceae bacterium]
MPTRTQFLLTHDPDLNNLRSPALIEIYKFWLGLRTGAVLPARSDFHPTDLPPNLMPHIAIADVIRNGSDLRFQWRLVGTHITEGTGRDVAGRYFDDVYGGDNHDDLVAAYLRIARNGAPLRWHGDCQFVDKEWMMTEVVGMPLSENGRTVDKLFMGMVFSQNVDLG